MTRVVRAVLSVILAIIGTFLILVALAELLIFLFIDSGNRDTYIDWITGPLIIFAAAAFIFLLWLILNYDRFAFINRGLGRIKREKKQKKLELPDFD